MNLSLNRRLADPLRFSQPPLVIQQLPLIQRPDLAGQFAGRFAYAKALVELALHEWSE